MGEPKLGSTVPLADTRPVGGVHRSRCPYMITDALSSRQSADSRRVPAALCAAGFGVRAAVAAEQCASEA